MMAKQIIRLIFLLNFIYFVKANQSEDAKFIHEYEKFMEAYCVKEDINSEILKKLDECDFIVFSKEGKEMENQCLIESAPKGSSVNDRRRLWCNNQQFYEKTRKCYSKKLEAKHKAGQPGEHVSEDQLRNDTLRAMECRKKFFKF